MNCNNIDILFYDNQDELATQAMNFAVKELGRLETFLSYKYGGAMQLVLFSNLTDYRQSNIGYNNPQLSSGGYLVIPNDLNSVYFNGSYSDLQNQLRKAICELILREMIYGGTLQDRFDRVRAPQLPVWFTEGLSVFLAESWSAEKENDLINAFNTNAFDNFNNLSNDYQVLAGQSIWRFLVEKYGSESVSTIVFIARYTHSVEAALYFQTQKNMSAFLQEWHNHFTVSMASDPGQNLPKGTANVARRISKKRFTDIAIDPTGNTVAIITNDFGRFHIWTYTINSDKTRLVYSGGNKVMNQQQALDFPKVKWNPATKNLCFLTYEKGVYKLLELNGRRIHSVMEFSDYQMVSSFDFSSTGDSIVFSAVRSGSSDIYLHNLKTALTSQLTKDLYEDKQPIYGKDGFIYFISNRSVSGFEYANSLSSRLENIFRFDSTTLNAVTRFNTSGNISSLISYNRDITGFISDHSGLKNAYAVLNDTAIISGQTNYRVAVIGQSLAQNGNTLAELLKLNGKYHIFTSQVPENPIVENLNPTPRKWLKTINNLDSLFAERNVMVSSRTLLGQDSVKISHFDTVKHTYIFQTGFDWSEVPFHDTQKAAGFFNFKKVAFRNSLQPEFLISQSDNRNLGSYLHNGLIKREALRNPVVMPYFKVAFSDLLKNHLAEVAARTSLDLLITDFSFRYALYKYRLDHDISLFRNSRKYDDGNLLLRQNLSTGMRYTLSIPFSEKSRLNVKNGVRRELNFLKGSETLSLTAPESNRYYFTNNLEYLFDNTTSLGLNMYSGIRFSGSYERLTQLGTSHSVSMVNADLRYSLPVFHKTLLAFRLAGSYNLGKYKVAYYLGGVENWTKREQFQSTPKLDETFLFQQWVCNLRGFNRGVRTGSSFMIVNAEIRLPVFQTFVKVPVESEFLKNFTFTGFVDAGTAFTGKTTADPSNPFNTIYRSTPNYDLSVTSQRNPFVMGVGYGLRTRLLGYFVKYDRAVGWIEKSWQKPMNYLSLGFDF